MKPFRSFPGMPAAILLALLAAACSLEPWSGREGSVVENVQVDTLRFLPYGSRYILRDSATPIRHIGFRTAYAVGKDCAVILSMGVDSVPVGMPAAFPAFSRIRLPGNPETCPIDTGGQSQVVPHTFKDGTIIRIANSALKITDSATLIRGTIAFDSIVGVTGLAETFEVNGLTFRDSSSLADRALFTDTVPPCKRLNQSDWWKGDSLGKGDTVKVRYSWVTLDASEGCSGPAARDSVKSAKRRSWRAGLRD